MLCHSHIFYKCIVNVIESLVDYMPYIWGSKIYHPHFSVTHTCTIWDRYIFYKTIAADLVRYRSGAEARWHFVKNNKFVTFCQINWNNEVPVDSASKAILPFQEVFTEPKSFCLLLKWVLPVAQSHKFLWLCKLLSSIGKFKMKSKYLTFSSHCHPEYSCYLLHLINCLVVWICRFASMRLSTDSGFVMVIRYLARLQRMYSRISAIRQLIQTSICYR